MPEFLSFVLPQGENERFADSAITGLVGQVFIFDGRWAKVLDARRLPNDHVEIDCEVN